MAVCRLKKEHIQPLRPRELCHQPQRLCNRLVSAAAPAAAALRPLPACGGPAPAPVLGPAASGAAAAAEARGRHWLVGLQTGCAAPAARQDGVKSG